MNFLYNYSHNIINYDLLNKFKYNSINNIPKLKFIILYFNFKKCDFKTLISALASLEIISKSKSVLITSQISNVSFKLRKGQPVGCKITLRKKYMKYFLFILINKITLTYQKKISKNNNLFSFKIKNILLFEKLSHNYQFFKTLSNLNINIITTTVTLQELIFLIKSFKICI